MCRIEDIPQNQLREFFTEHWGSPKIVIASGVYDCCDLNGIGVLGDGCGIIGLITYVLRDKECEIISLNSVEEGKGIGTILIRAVESIAVQNNCQVIKVTTTNDNLRALGFYQKRGFVLSMLRKNAVEKARELKPEIPLTGYDGIPIRDEIELEKLLPR